MNRNGSFGNLPSGRKNKLKTKTDFIYAQRRPYDIGGGMVTVRNQEESKTDITKFMLYDFFYSFGPQPELVFKTAIEGDRKGLKSGEHLTYIL